MSDEMSPLQKLRAATANFNGVTGTLDLFSLARLAQEEESERLIAADHVESRNDTVRHVDRSEGDTQLDPEYSERGGNLLSEVSGGGNALENAMQSNSPRTGNDVTAPSLPMFSPAEAITAISALPTVWNIGSTISSFSLVQQLEALPHQYTPAWSRAPDVSSEGIISTYTEIDEQDRILSTGGNQHASSFREILTPSLIEYGQQAKPASNLDASGSLSEANIIYIDRSSTDGKEVERNAEALNDHPPTQTIRPTPASWTDENSASVSSVVEVDFPRLVETKPVSAMTEKTTVEAVSKAGFANGVTETGAVPISPIVKSDPSSVATPITAPAGPVAEVETHAVPTPAAGPSSVAVSSLLRPFDPTTFAPVTSPRSDEASSASAQAANPDVSAKQVVNVSSWKEDNIDSLNPEIEYYTINEINYGPPGPGIPTNLAAMLMSGLLSQREFSNTQEVSDGFHGVNGYDSAHEYLATDAAEDDLIAGHGGRASETPQVNLKPPLFSSTINSETGEVYTVMNDHSDGF